MYKLHTRMITYMFNWGIMKLCMLWLSDSTNTDQAFSLNVQTLDSNV